MLSRFKNTVEQCSYWKGVKSYSIRSKDRFWSILTGNNRHKNGCKTIIDTFIKDSKSERDVERGRRLESGQYENSFLIEPRNSKLQKAKPKPQTSLR